MERLDHFVVHIDNNPAKLASLKQQIEPLGFPFNPSAGKGTKGFKVANVWVGYQCLELPFLKTTDGGGWKPEWVKKYNQGTRGIFGLCIMTDRLDALYTQLLERGIPAGKPERITFKLLFGLLKKSLPFRKIYTPPIPGTDLQIFFLEMDNDEKYRFTKKYFMKPNAEDNGIVGIREATIKAPFSDEAWGFIHTLFPNLTGVRPNATYDMGTSRLHFVESGNSVVRVELQAETTNASYSGRRFSIENVELLIP